MLFGKESSPLRRADSALLETYKSAKCHVRTTAWMLFLKKFLPAKVHRDVKQHIIYLENLFLTAQKLPDGFSRVTLAVDDLRRSLD